MYNIEIVIILHTCIENILLLQITTTEVAKLICYVK